MSWRDAFDQGVQHFRASQLDSALEHFNNAITLGGDNSTVYDSRSAVYEKLGKTTDALKDSKMAIDLNPSSWQGYARSARLFLKLKRCDAAIRMSDLALERVKMDDSMRRNKLLSVKDQATAALKAQARHASRRAYHFGKLPFEIGSEIFLSLAEEDPCYAVVLSHVCKHWRDIALNTAPLWKVLALSDRAPVRKAELWSDRAKRRIVELRIRKGLYPHRVATFQKLAGVSWEHLRVLSTAIEPDDLSDSFQAANLRDLSVLDSLEAISDKMSLLRPWAPLLRNSQLRFLTLHQVSPRWVDVIDCFSELLVVSLYPAVFMESATQPEITLLDFLQANPRLRKISMHFLPGVSILRHAGVLLTDLAHLELVGPAPVLGAFVAKITFPNIKTLRLTHFSDVDGPLCELIRRQHISGLIELRLSRCALSAAVVLQFLREASNLVTLELSHLGDKLASQVIEKLAERQDGSWPSLCPLLAEANFSHCPDVTSGSIIRLVKSRQAAPGLANGGLKDDGVVGPQAPSQSRIVSLVIDGCPLVESSVLPWLRSQVESVSCVYLTKKEAKRNR